MLKVAFLNPTIPPRVVSLLNRITADNRITIKAFFFAVSQKNRAWELNTDEYEKIKFSYVILKSLSLSVGIHDFHNSFISSNIWSELSQYNPDVVVLPGWADINSYITLLWAKRHNKKIILRTESTSYEDSLRRRLFLPVTKYICNNSDLIIASSQRAHTYAQSLTATKIITIHSSFDTRSFQNQIAKRKKVELKKHYQVTEKKAVYFNGQAIERKGILPLLEAFSYPRLRNVALLITGSGKLENTITAYAKKYPNIYYFGYQKQHKLPDFYKMADFFILPSYEETWGIVTVEALAAGLPVLVSKFAGSAELISKNTGFILDTIDTASILRKLHLALRMPKKQYDRISQTNRQFVRKSLSYETIAKKFVQALIALE